MLGFSGSSERELGMDMGCRVGVAVRASGTAGLGAGTQRLVDDGLDGAGAAATLGAAAEAAIDLLGIARQVIRGADGAADIVIAKDVAGTDNHTNGGPIRRNGSHRYSRQHRDAKGKTVFSSDSKLIPDTGWNESKTAVAAAPNAHSIENQRAYRRPQFRMPQSRSPWLFQAQPAGRTGLCTAKAASPVALVAKCGNPVH
jgi:hypothetical protein